MFVFDVEDPAAPVLRQTLPVGLAPEGLAYDAAAGVLAVASEKDDRGDKFRSSVALFTLAPSAAPEYPTLVSAPRDNAGPAGPFIPFSALSGQAAASPLGLLLSLL